MIRAIKTAKYKLLQLVLMFTFTFAVSSCEEYLPDGGLYDELVNSDVQEQPGSDITPEAVDLGLPSGVKWATFNVGATRPEEYGGYYAWGETKEKSDYSWSTYKWCKGSETSMTKYCTDSSYGTVDNKTTLDPEDDVAHVNWGGSWRMPTRAEQDELRENCAWIWTTLNGVNGYKVISKTNGNSIFLPVAGYRNGSEVHYRDSYGYCWSSSLYGSDSHSAYYLNFSSDGLNYFNGGFRFYGRSVRPVYGEYDEPEKPTEKPEGTYISESFATSFGSFTTQQTVGNYPWVIDYSTAKATSYADNANHEATSWLVSSTVDFTEETEAYVAFEYIIRYPDSDSLAANHQLLISDDYAGDVAEATWVDVPYGAVEGSDWSTFYNAKVAVPAEFLGKSSVVFALRYAATTKSSTWEVKNFVVAHGTVEENKPAETGVYTVAQAIAAYTGTAMPIVVKGYIVGSIDGQSINDANFSNAAVLNTNLLIADNVNETDVTKCLPVQLPSGDARDALNLVDNPGNYKKQVVLTGSLEKYFDVAGLKSVTEYVMYSTVSVSSEGGGSVAISGTSGTSATFEDGANVTVAATPDDGYVFEGWYVDGSEEPVSANLEYTFTISEHIALVAMFKEEYSPSGSVDGHAYVDLGLPSGVKWATCNIGATKPEEYGGDYAWGETEEKTTDSWQTYKWCSGSNTTLTKYCTRSQYGAVDNKTFLDFEDDVAHVQWGGSWRMPTKAELDELLDNCIWTWTDINVNGSRVYGHKVTSKTNGNSIFLPAAGYYDGWNRIDPNGGGGYWSSSLDGSNCIYAHSLSLGPGGYSCRTFQRGYSFSVRPVYGEPAEKYTVTVSSEGGGSVAISGSSAMSLILEAGSSVTVVATPDDGYEFEGWYVDGVSVSTNLEYTFTISENIALVAKFKEEYSQSGSVDGHAYVDLGLPSGVKWATCNVGATTPEGYGSYYAWGETEEKENYDWSTYVWCNGSETSMTKYCTDSSYGTVDNKTVLDPEDDVAHVKWGGSWRMPTKAEEFELRFECTWQWTTLNGVNGYKVTSKTNGNSIFLPAAGSRHNTILDKCGSYGFYWTSSLCEDYSRNALSLGFSISGCSELSGYRSSAHNVRPVYGEYVAPVAKYTVSVNSEGGGSVAISGNSGASATFEAGSSVTVVATPDEGYTFSGWYANDALVSTDAEYAFTISEDVVLVAKFEQTVNYNGHEYVDLGLPSGLKWATCNIGASEPEEYGGYYAWGETEEKEDYSLSTYQWCNGSLNTMTKYCTSSSYGTVDNKTVLDPEDDVAHVKWGGSWRMPTLAEQNELLNNCTWTWTTQNGVNGCRVTSKTNGNSIFLPVAGFRGGTGVGNRGSDGYYWSSSLSSSSSDNAYYLKCHLGSPDWYDYYRYYGYPVRPVCD